MAFVGEPTRCTLDSSIRGRQVSSPKIRECGGSVHLNALNQSSMISDTI